MITGYKYGTVSMYVNCWEKAGYIKLVKQGKPAVERVYKLLKESVKAPARDLNGLAHDKPKKEKKVVKDLQTTQERAAIQETHVQVGGEKQEVKRAEIKEIRLTSALLKGRRNDYSPTIFTINDTGKIVCKDTGFVVDELKLGTGESYGYTCARKSA
jgi:hypothetical protein